MRFESGCRDHKAVVVKCTLGGSHVMASGKKKATKKTRGKKTSRKARGKKAGKKVARKKAAR